MAKYIKGNPVPNATYYELHKKEAGGSTPLATKNEINFNLDELNLSAGVYTLAVKAKADGYEDSDFSNEVTYNVKGTTYYPLNPNDVTASPAKLGGTYAFAESITPLESNYHFTKFKATFKPTAASDFDIAIIVGERDISDGSFLVVKKDTHLINNTDTVDLSVELDIDITMTNNQVIGVVAPSGYIYMTAGTVYSGVWNLVLGSLTVDKFTEGQKLTANPTVASGKIPLLFFIEN